MKVLYTILVVITFFLGSCADEQTSQEEDLQALHEKYEIINSLATSMTCVDSDNWAFVDIGSKACGGPMGYIAYPLNIDVDHFLQLVAEYTEAQRQYNIKWGIFSDCMVPPRPTRVACQDNLPVLVY